MAYRVGGQTLSRSLSDPDVHGKTLETLKLLEGL